MFRITLILGKKLKKLLVYSHASVIKVSGISNADVSVDSRKDSANTDGRITVTLKKDMGNHGSSSGFSVVPEIAIGVS